jgi:hypothetical protein
MSRCSFPRPQHAVLLREKIAERLRSYPVPVEVSERGLDHYRCCYRFGIRRAPEQDEVELSVHFQVAERLEAAGSAEELIRILDLFVERHFASDATPERHNRRANKDDGMVCYKPGS